MHNVGDGLDMNGMCHPQHCGEQGDHARLYGAQQKRLPDHKKHKKRVYYMNDYVDKVIAGDLVPVNIIVKGKRKMGQWPERVGAVGDAQNLFRVQAGHPDMGVFRDVRLVIKIKRRMQGVGIDETSPHDKNKHRSKLDCFKPHISCFVAVAGKNEG